MKYSELQLREVFHLSLLRFLVRSLPPEGLVLKGGSNLRFFFRSDRFSEGMDLDVQSVEVHVLRDKVMDALDSDALRDAMNTYGVMEIVPPDLQHAKQTETVQRFKVHLITGAGIDLFTKLEFSRRGISGAFAAEEVSTERLRQYRMPPLVVPHYTAAAALLQKLVALRDRQVPEARDVFDANLLRTQTEADVEGMKDEFGPEDRERVRERILAIGFEEYRDKVLAFLHPDDRAGYDARPVWDEMRLNVIELIGNGGRG